MTLKEVADRAGVSIATASRALNKPDVVQEATRRKVLQAVKELHYRPNRFAQSLAGGRTNALGVIVSNIENPFFLDILHALEQEASQQGFELIYENTDYRPERLTAAVERMLGRPLAGLALIVSERDDEAVALLEGWNQPVVLLDSMHTPRLGATIELRYEKAMQRTVEYLYALGHRRMAFVGHHSALDPLRERENAFIATVSAFPDVESATAASTDSLDGGRQAMRQLLESGFAHGRHVRQRLHGHRRAAELRERGPDARGRLGDGIRQYRALRVPLSAVDHRQYSPAADRQADF